MAGVTRLGRWRISTSGGRVEPRRRLSAREVDEILIAVECSLMRTDPSLARALSSFAVPRTTSVRVRRPWVGALRAVATGLVLAAFALCAVTIFVDLYQRALVPPLGR